MGFAGAGWYHGDDMNQGDRILKKLETHDLEFVRIGKKLEEHDVGFSRIGKKLEEHDQRFDAHDHRFVDHGRQIDILFDKVDGIEAKLDACATKVELRELRQEMFTHHDEVMVILRRLDEERVFANARFDRLEQRGTAA